MRYFPKKHIFTLQPVHVILFLIHPRSCLGHCLSIHSALFESWLRKPFHLAKVSLPLRASVVHESSLGNPSLGGE
jgi:hypothetical protein